MGDITILIIQYAARSAVLTLLLCGMVKILKLNFFFPGLLVSAMITGALDLIPGSGHFLAVPALFFCTWKVTGSSVPHALLIAILACALMFAMQLLLVNPLLGNLRPVKASGGIVKTNQIIIGIKPERLVPAVAAATNAPAIPGPPKPATPHLKSADEILQEFIVKGATQNGSKSMLILRIGKKTYTLVMSEQVLVQIASGPCRVRLLNLSETWATVEVNGEAAYLKLH